MTENTCPFVLKDAAALQEALERLQETQTMLTRLLEERSCALPSDTFRKALELQLQHTNQDIDFLSTGLSVGSGLDLEKMLLDYATRQSANRSHLAELIAQKEQLESRIVDAQNWEDHFLRRLALLSRPR